VVSVYWLCQQGAIEPHNEDYLSSNVGTYPLSDRMHALVTCSFLFAVAKTANVIRWRLRLTSLIVLGHAPVSWLLLLR